MSIARFSAIFVSAKPLGVNSVIRLIGKFSEPMAQFTATNLS